jgi:3-methyladenine DNA glycosylase AlkD
MPANLSAAEFIVQLEAYRSPEQAREYERSFRPANEQNDEDDRFIGVRMGQVFALAKELADLPLDAIETLLESPVHEVRVGGVSVMDRQARAKKTTEQRRRELFELYLRRHDRINNWDLVDRAAPWVIGGYLFDKPRDTLYELARSGNIWERRTSMVSTYYFIRQGDLDDTFAIAALLLNDDQDLIHKATGGWLREAGKKDPQRLLRFLDEHAAAMPRIALRYAIEHLTPEQRERYLSMKRAG